MIDGFKAWCYLQNFHLWRESVKNVIKRPWVKVYYDDGEIKTEEDDGDPTASTWRMDDGGRYQYYTIKYNTGYGLYIIEVRETHRRDLVSGAETISYLLEIRGSFKKNHFGGTNYGRFTFTNLLNQIQLVEENLKLDVSQLRITNIEPVVAIPTEVPVYKFLDNNLISHWGGAFSKYDPDGNGRCIGFHKGDIKIYDKQLQNDLPKPLMQYEHHFDKMGKVNELGIYYIIDLKDKQKVNSLLGLLLNTWDDIMFFDDTVDINLFRKGSYQYEMIKYGNTEKYWRGLKKEVSRGTYYNRIAEFKNISINYGSDFHGKTRQVMIKEWEMLLNDWTDLPTVKIDELENFTGTVRGNIFQLDIRGGSINDTSGKVLGSNSINELINISSVHKVNKSGILYEDKEEERGNNIINTTLPVIEQGTTGESERVNNNISKATEEDTKELTKNTSPEDKEAIPERRFCKVCRADISHQRRDSKYCSEKFRGKEAKKCRNRISNYKYSVRKGAGMLKKQLDAKPPKMSWQEKIKGIKERMGQFKKKHHEINNPLVHSPDPK